MSNKHWEELIPKKNIELFNEIEEEFFSTSKDKDTIKPISTSWDSLFHIKEYNDLLEKPLSQFAKKFLYIKEPGKNNILKARISKRKRQLQRSRIKKDYLAKLIPDWIKEEIHGTTLLIPHTKQHIKKNIFGTRHLLSQVSFADIKKMEITSSFQNILCLIAWKFTISELAELASQGDDESSFRLIQLNKRFISANWMHDRIIQAQRFHDDNYFQSLGKSVMKDAVRERFLEAKIGFAVLFLWHLGFNDLPKKELLDFVHKKYGYPDSNLPSFSAYVTRLGLKKYRKV